MKHYYLKKNDEFSIKEEIMAINRRHSSIQTTPQRKYIVILQDTSTQVAARGASRHIEQASKRYSEKN